MLEFGAVNFYDGARTAKKYFRGGFDDARLAGAGGAQEQQIADGTARRVQAGGENLEQFDERLHAIVLPNDFGAQRVLKFDCVRAAHIWIE